MNVQSSPLSIRKATQHDIATIQDIAHKTWTVAYADILSTEQLTYMLDLIYSTDSLTKQMSESHQFYLAEVDAKDVGFSDFGWISDKIYKLHKIYVLPSAQKTGAGKALLNFTINSAKEHGAEALILNVNRNNTAKTFYEKMGFAVIHEEDIDIGNGYFMNDYVMQLGLTS